MGTHQLHNKNAKGHLEIGGCDTVELTQKFSTPLYVLDYKKIEYEATSIVDAAKRFYPNSLICYASKALACTALYAITAKLGLGADVASGGELYTAMHAKVDPNGVYFHGNNKTDAELNLALSHNIHAVVVDNLDEIDALDALAKATGKTQGILLRVNPGVEAHTHEYIQTAKVDSKFGFLIADGTALKAVKVASTKKNLKLLGLHCHIGSQIFDTKAFALAVDKMTDFIVQIKKTLKIEVAELNMGGGFGIKYTDDDKPLPASSFVEVIATKLNECIKSKGIIAPRLILEPGRSIVGEAGITLYTVGTIKTIPSIRTYVAVDGGMFDNPRHALYQAKYDACIANKYAQPKTDIVSIAGKCCESGDIVASNVKIQKPSRGDILAVFSTGAYNYSMASNYNRNLIPPIVLANDGKAEYIVKPQTYQDLVARDVFIKL